MLEVKDIAVAKFYPLVLYLHFVIRFYLLKVSIKDNTNII
jgi:hypothetical protein